MSMTLAAARHYALRDIDRAAGQARLRYITDVPGQQAVYLVKLEQARAYLQAVAVDAQAAVPPYVSAEAAATGQTAAAVAQTVVTLAQLWSEQVGPAIEGARMGGKAAVSAAGDAAGVQAALDAALATLGAI